MYFKLITFYIFTLFSSTLFGKYLFDPSKYKYDPHNIESFGVPRKIALSQKDLNVLVWNIKKAEYSNFHTDLKSLIKNYEVILLQEGVFNPNYLFSYLKNEGLQGVIGRSFELPYETDGTYTGVVTLATAPSTKKSLLKTIFKEPIVKTPKVSLFSTYQIENSKKQLLIINTHAINFVTDFTHMFELKRIKNKAKNHKGPILWAGDFNSWTKRRLTYLRKLVRELDLTEVKIPVNYRQMDLGLVLDFAFIRGAKVKKIKDLSYIRSSDHRPLSFKIDIFP